MSRLNGLPKGWTECTFGDILLSISNGTTEEQNPDGVGVPVSRIETISNETIDYDRVRYIASPSSELLERFLLRTGDLLFSHINSATHLGKTALYRDDSRPLLHGMNLLLLRSNEVILSSSLLHYLCAYYRKNGLFSGIAQHAVNQASINQRKLGSITLLLPPRTEQCRIVAKIEELFSDLDAGVAALKRAKANLKRYRAAVLMAAVEGKLTEDWRSKHSDTQPASSLLERILTERRKKWEAEKLAKFAAAKKEPPKNWKAKYVEPTPSDTSNLPELPQGWCWTSVDHLIVEPTCNGISIKGTDSPPGVPALRLNAMTANGFDYEQRRYIPISSKLAADLAIRSGDLFVSRGNGSLHLVGRSVLAQEPPELIVFPDTMIRVTLTEAGSLRRFVSHALSSRFLRQQVERKARTTAGIYKISQRDVEGFMLPIPPAAEQERVVAEVEERLTLISAAEKQIDADLIRAARLRQSILKQAFEGKLVPQDPNDESVSALLERIRASRPAANNNGKPRVVKQKRSKQEAS